MTIFHIATKVSEHPEAWKMETWSINQVLSEINRDHSSEFEDYDETDWRDGWREWVDPEIHIMISPHLSFRH